MWLSNNSHLCSSFLSPRGLRFIQVFLQSLVNGEKDESNPNLMRVNISKGYEVALRKYHGWLVQQFFKVSPWSCHQSSAWLRGKNISSGHLSSSQATLFAAPYKSDFLKTLSKGKDVKDEECTEKIRKFLVNFTATVDAIYEMYSRMNADLDYKVWLSLSNNSWPSVWLSLFHYLGSNVEKCTLSFEFI